MGSIGDVKAGLKKDLGDKFVTEAADLRDVERLPIDIYPFDFATGGGFPRGRISILWGEESSGKTNLALKAMIANQELEPDKMNVFLDIEGSFDAVWAEKMGLDTSKKKLAVIQPHYAEQAVNIIQSIVQADDAGVIVLDSIGAMIGINEEESDASKMAVGGVALLITKMVKKLTVGLSIATSEGRYPTIIIINQMRNKIGVMFGSPDEMPGGKALKHCSALTIKVRGKNLIDTNINKLRPSYKEMFGKVVKAKVPTLYENFEFKFPVVNQGGLKIGYIDDWNTVSNQLKDLGWMVKKTKTVEAFGKSYPTYKALREEIYADPTVIAIIREKILEAYIEEVFGDEVEA